MGDINQSYFLEKELPKKTYNNVLDIGSKDVMAYCFKSNLAQASDAIWSTQVNTTILYNFIITV